MKKLVKLCAIFSLAGMLAGCGTTVGGAGGSKEDLNINVKDMANELKSGLTFEDTLSELDTDSVKDSVIIVSTGATAEEIAVFEAADSDAADKVKTACEDRKEKQTTSYADYKPSETGRLDKAIIKEDGNYVVYCIKNEPVSKRLSDSFFVMIWKYAIISIGIAVNQNWKWN